MPAAVVIPARYASTRFPGKALAPLNGKPIIQHVWERASLARLIDQVVIATDDERIMKAAESFGARAIMTSAHHSSGTDRIAEAVGNLECDIIVNVQGDEPLIAPEVIDLTAGLLGDDPLADIATVAVELTSEEDAANPNVVKAVVGFGGYALYFSRAPVPYHREQWPSLEDVGKPGGKDIRLLQHIGIYGYRRESLLKFASLKPTPLEETEKLEQLRALENGMRIKVAVTEYRSLGVDTPEDLERVQSLLA